MNKIRTEKRLLFLAFLILPLLSSGEMQAQNRYSGGSGTITNPYLIATAADLIQLSADCNSEVTYDDWCNANYSLYFKMTADIDFSGQPVVDGSNFTPIGHSGPLGDQDLTIFPANFDGDGHTISGVKVNRSAEDNGIFGAIGRSATVKNITVAASTFIGGSWTGAVVGTNAGAILENCHVKADVNVSPAANNAIGIGGVLGRLHGSQLYNAYVQGCTSAATVGDGGKSGILYVGGVTGYISSNNDRFRQCFSCATINVAEPTTTHAGSLVGYRNIYSGQKLGYVEKCFYAVQGEDVGGSDGEETIDMLKTVPVAEFNDEAGAKVIEYTTFNGMPSLAIYQWGAIYSGQHYLYGIPDPFPLYEGEVGYYNNPYTIRTAEDLRKLSEAVNYRRDYNKKYFRIDADIDLGGGETTNFKPIGTKDMPFNGVIYGNDHTISGMVILRSGQQDSDGYVGLVGMAGRYCYVYDLTLTNSRFTGHHNTGAICGYGYYTFHVKNCHVGADVTVKGLPGAIGIGGIVGRLEGVIEGCTSAATVDGTAEGCSRIGGLAGSMDENEINHCLAIGQVLGGNNQHVGAILGWAGTNMKYTTNFYATECQARGVDGSEIVNARLYTNADANPSISVGSLKATYKSVQNKKVYITAYENAILYQGKYYYSTRPPLGHFPLYAGDKGTEEKPFLIKTKEDMSLFTYDVTAGCSFQNMHLSLDADLNFGGGNATNFKGAGNKDFAFQGTFNGQGHTISGIYIKEIFKDWTNARYLSIFGHLGEGALVRDLIVADSYFSGELWVAPIAGTVDEGATIRNCHVLGNVTVDKHYGTSRKAQYTAGLAGYSLGNIEGCISAAKLYMSNYSGGITGYQCGGSVKDCLFLGQFTSSDKDAPAGALIGWVEANEGVLQSSLANNYYYGEPTIGGLGGFNENSGKEALRRDASGTRKAEQTSQAPEGLGQQVKAYDSKGSISVITAFEDGLLYQGHYYHSTRPATYFPLYEGEDGSAEKPFHIKSMSDWEKFVSDVDFTVTFQDKHLALDIDLDFGGAVNAFKPVSSYWGYRFLGSFDGQGHTLSGINICGEEFTQRAYTSVFGYLNGPVTIKNLTVADSRFDGQECVAPIVGWADYSMGNVTISNCHVADNVVVINTKSQGSNAMAGLIGRAYYATISGCTTAAHVELGSSSGGIAGQISDATLRHNLFLGDLTIDEYAEESAKRQQGAIAGYHDNSTLYMCYYLPGSPVKACANNDLAQAKEACALGQLPPTLDKDHPTAIYKSFEGAPGMTVYGAPEVNAMSGIAYDGLFYCHSSLATLLKTIVNKTDVNFENLAEANLDHGLVDDIFYQLDNNDGSGYDSAEKAIVIAKATTAEALCLDDPESEVKTGSFTGLMFRVPAGIGRITISTRTTGKMKLAVKVGHHWPHIVAANEKGDVVVNYDETEETMVYVCGYSSDASASRAKQPAAANSVSIYGISIQPTGDVARGTQTLELAEGWNWIGTRLRESASIDLVAEKATKIIGKDGDYQVSQWGNYGSLKAIEPGKAYKVQAPAAATVTLPEAPIYSYGADLPLYGGWNWVAYPGNSNAALTDVVTNPTEGDCITGLTEGFAVYSGGQWKGTLNCLQTGHGYLYQTTGSKSLHLDFPTSGESIEAFADMVNAARKYQSTMNIVAEIMQRNNMPLTEEGYRLMAYSSEGELRGVSYLIDKKHFITIHGESYDNFTFAVENQLTGETYPVTGTMAFQSILEGSISNPYIFNLESTVTGISDLKTVGNAQSTAVYDLQGRRVTNSTKRGGLLIVNEGGTTKKLIRK